MLENLHFDYYQNIIKAQFELARKKFDHPGEKGVNVELILKDFLKELVPEDKFISTGTIIDSFKKKSRQMDIVIGNKALQPLIKDYNNPNIFIIEAVQCVGEVKTCLNNFPKILTHCEDFKNLTVKPIKGMFRQTNPSDAKRFFDKKPYFCFCFDTTLSPKSLLDKLTEYYSEVPIEQQIDAVFLLGIGAIINFGDGQGALEMGEGSEKQKGFYFIDNQDHVVEIFVQWLFAVMQPCFSFINPIMNYLFHEG